MTWVALYPDDREAAQVDTTGLEPVLETPSIELYRVPGAGPRDASGGSGREAAVWSAHLLALLVAAAATITRIMARRERDARAEVG